MSVITDNPDIDSPLLLSTTHPRSSFTYSPRSTPLPVSSAPSSTSQGVSDERSLSSSISSLRNRDVENEESTNSQEIQGQNHDREGENVNMEEAAMANSASITERGFDAEETGDDSQQQVINYQAANTEAINTMSGVVQHSTSEENITGSENAGVLNSDGSISTSVIQIQPQPSDNNIIQPDFSVDFAELSTADFLLGSSNMNDNEARQADSTEQEAILPRQRATDEANDGSAAAAAAADDDDDDDDNDGDSSSDEDDIFAFDFLDAAENNSLPDEEELKEIVEAGELSAEDELYWDSKMSKILQDPEYSLGASGCLHWLLEGNNKPKVLPKEKVALRSPTATIGGYDWQMKFYPRGNGSEYLSTYLECVDMMNSDQVVKTEKDPNGTEHPEEKNTKKMGKLATRQPIDTPIPYLQEENLTKPSSVAAIVTIILYNPEEPRVNYHETVIHKFTPTLPDWGWTRFCGSLYDLKKRKRGQRQALLRHGKLAFRTYIRLVKDPTDCLGHHDIPWDSLNMTGIRSLTLMGYDVQPSDSHMVCAVSSWLMLKPFRQFLYNVNIPDPFERPRDLPMPLITNLLKILYFWRLPLKHERRCISLGNIKNAIGWHGIDPLLEESDVIEVWRVLRAAMELEIRKSPDCLFSSSSPSLSSSPSTDMERFVRLLGRRTSPATDSPNYRIPVKGVESIQEGINKTKNFLTPEDPLPEFLSVELERQLFDGATRRWKKVVDKVNIQETIKLRDVEYLLYGMIVHKGDLRSCLYQAILRPQGPNGKWYQFLGDSDGGRVVCLTRKEAITAHEGFSIDADDKTNAEAIETSAVAYIVMYIRSDVAAMALGTEEEPWDIPNWLVELIEVDKREEIDDEDGSSDEDADDCDGEIPPAKSSEVREGSDLESVTGNKKKAVEEISRELEVQIIDSRFFLSHDFYGNFNPSDPQLTVAATAIATESSSPYVHNIKLKSTATVDEITNVLVDIIKDVRCKRQCRFWAMDSYGLATKRASFMAPGRSLKRKNYLSERRERRFWVHVTPLEDLPPLPAGVDNKPKDSERESGIRNAAQDGHEYRGLGVENLNNTRQESGDSAGQQEEIRESVRQGDNNAGDAAPGESDESHATQQTQVNGSSVIARTISSGDIDEAAVPVFMPLRDADMNMSEAAGYQDMPSALSEPTATADSLNGINVSTSQASVSDATNRPPIFGPAHEDSSTPLPSNNANDANSINSNRIQEDAIQDTSNTPNKVPAEAYIFLKIFDQEAQKLIPWGSFITPVTNQIGTTIQTKLGLFDCEDMSLWDEYPRSDPQAINPDRTFAEENVDRIGDVIIYCKTLPQDRIDMLATRAAFHTPVSYIRHLRNLDNFPDFVDGPITNSDFSSESCNVNYRNSHFHGHGRTISFSGAEYTGEFRLDKRHGLGQMIYANGDEYYGSWVDGVREGHGRFVEAATGNEYVGGWRKDRQFGEGVTTWKAADVSERLCRICWDLSADAAMYDCGHVVACLECAKRVESCPVCRRRVISAMKLFYAT